MISRRLYKQRGRAKSMELKVLDEIRDKLKEIDIAGLTPLEALNILQYLKGRSDKFQ